jgi:hypothetical protein
LDSRRLAPRSGVGPMDGTNNPSLPLLGRTIVTRHILCLALRAIGFADVRSGILPPQSTKSSGTILDSRRLAPRSGVGPMDGTNNPSRSTNVATSHPSCIWKIESITRRSRRALSIWTDLIEAQRAHIFLVRHARMRYRPSSLRSNCST